MQNFLIPVLLSATVLSRLIVLTLATASFACITSLTSLICSSPCRSASSSVMAFALLARACHARCPSGCAAAPATAIVHLARARGRLPRARRTAPPRQLEPHHVCMHMPDRVTLNDHALANSNGTKTTRQPMKQRFELNPSRFQLSSHSPVPPIPFPRVRH